MEATLGIIALGFLGQALFGARLIVQLFQSEKQKRVANPVVFWQLSLAGSLLFLLYGLLRHDFVVILGQTLSYFIYIRNLQLKNAWTTFPSPVRIVLILLPVVVVSGSIFVSDDPIVFHDLVAFSHPVMIIGTIGQLALNLRFVYQWHYSEKHGTSALPVGFWQISVWASVLVIIYALFHPLLGIEPVLLVSQGLGITVYIRNLFIARNQVSAV